VSILRGAIADSGVVVEGRVGTGSHTVARVMRVCRPVSSSSGSSISSMSCAQENAVVKAYGFCVRCGVTSVFCRA
jgi:hypothetical protein